VLRQGHDRRHGSLRGRLHARLAPAARALRTRSSGHGRPRNRYALWLPSAAKP
jgi:hypothetical protein